MNAMLNKTFLIALCALAANIAIAQGYSLSKGDKAYFGLAYTRYPWEESVGVVKTPEPTPDPNATETPTP